MKKRKHNGATDGGWWRRWPAAVRLATSRMGKLVLDQSKALLCAIRGGLCFSIVNSFGRIGVDAELKKSRVPHAQEVGVIVAVFFSGLICSCISWNNNNNNNICLPSFRFLVANTVCLKSLCWCLCARAAVVKHCVWQQRITERVGSACQSWSCKAKLMQQFSSVKYTQKTSVFVYVNAQPHITVQRRTKHDSAHGLVMLWDIIIWRVLTDCPLLIYTVVFSDSVIVIISSSVSHRQVKWYWWLIVIGAIGLLARHHAPPGRKSPQTHDQMLKDLIDLWIC